MQPNPKQSFLQSVFSKAFSGPTVKANPATSTPVAPVVQPKQQTGLPLNYALNDGTQVNTTSQGKTVNVPPIFQKVVSDTEAKYPSLPKGIIPATIMQESSWGQIGKQKASNLQGKNLYMASLNPNQLKEMNIPFDDTATSTIQALGAYLDKKRQLLNPDGTVRAEYKNPKDLYLDRFWANTKNSLNEYGKKAYKTEQDFLNMRKKVGEAFDSHYKTYAQESP